MHGAGWTAPTGNTNLFSFIAWSMLKKVEKGKSIHIQCQCIFIIEKGENASSMIAHRALNYQASF